MTDLYAVIGNPVAHSKSPLIHAAFARAQSQSLEYQRLFSELGEFVATVKTFRAQGGTGINVTVPFKLEAFALADTLTERAQQARSVNVLVFEGDHTRGDNTDGIGLVRDIVSNLGHAVQGKRVLLLGAGGAARGAMGPLLQEAPRTLTIANRTAGKALALATQFSAFARACALQAGGYTALARQQFDIIINATSAGLNDSMPDLPEGLYAKGALAYDMVYGRETPFMKHAQAAGATVADGLGMLVEQAAESFLIWRGVRPATAPVIAALRRGELT